MNRLRLGLILFLLFNSCATSQTAKERGQTKPLPKIYLVYVKNGPFERECSAAINKPIKGEDADEIEKRLGEFQSSWDKTGNAYMQTLINEMGWAFPYRDVPVNLTACEFSSMSAPLIIYVKGFLSSAPRQHAIANFPVVIFHELMHIYLRSIGDTSSQLLKKYSSEDPRVLAQLQVMALEVFVVKKAGEQAVFNWLDTRYRTRFTAAHKRAWEIVNDIEGYEEFVKEIKQTCSKKLREN